MDARQRMLIAICGMFLMLGGCSWQPFGQDKDKADGGTTETPREHCSLKARACGNSCLDRGSACSECCVSNAEACDRGESYSFYSCPDKE